jgi:CBS domain-containing protein
LERPVRDFPDLIHLAPPVAHSDSLLNDLVLAMSRNPSAHCVFVTDVDDRVLGVISEQAVDVDLLTQVLPEPVWSEIREWDARELVRAATVGRRTARDLMTRVQCLRVDQTLREALAIMSHRKDSLLPLVDDQGRLLGYLTLFDTLAGLLSAPR